MKIHFLNVGHGDCTLIEFESRSTTMVDINIEKSMDEETLKEISKEYILVEGTLFAYALHNKNGLNYLIEKGYNIKLQNPYDYLKKIKKESLFRFICTHPHEDHFSGISKLNKEYPITNLWLSKELFLSEFNTEDNIFYKDQFNSKSKLPTVLKLMENDSGKFWSDDGIQILSPNKELIELARKNKNPNQLSLVLLITYGEIKIILGGDAEKENWEYILENYEDEIKDITILKASHHGRDSGFYQDAVKVMKPKYTIVSVGKKPETDSTNKYRKYCNNVWSTRWKGNIVFDCDKNGTVEPKTEYER